MTIILEEFTESSMINDTKNEEGFEEYAKS
jgi:hypothetical protein